MIKEWIKTLDKTDLSSLKYTEKEFLSAVDDHLKKYGALCVRPIDEYLRNSAVLSEFLPGYGSFCTFLGLKGGDKKAQEFPSEKAKLKGAILLLKEKGYIVYEPSLMLTKSKQKVQK